MADTSNLQPSHPKSHTPLEQQDQISSHHTLDNNFIEEEEEDDDIVNIQDQHAPYFFNFNPFSSSSSYHHHHHHQQQVNSNSSSCCSSEPESEYDSTDSTVYPNYLYGHHEEYDQMDYITDLFHSRDSPTDVGINVSEPDYFVSNNNNNNIEELGLGLRLASIESDSDTEDLGQVADQNDDDDNIIQTTDLNLEHVLDCPSFDMDGVDERDEYDTSSVIDRIEEISVSSDGGEANMGDLEWEILLAVNNLERDLELVMDGGEGLLYTTELDTLIGQFVETVRGLRGGSPPAAKSVIDSLPLVALKTGDAKDEYDDDGDNEICAVCKDGISIGEKVMQLPCRHHYHGECIVPWLSIRNTCPVCRFELPTDDVDYERRKNMENDDELRVAYGFDVDLLS